jgi:hypothetical protein
MGVKPRYFLSLDCHSKQAGDEPVILFDDIVEIFDLPQFTVVGNISLFFQLLKGFWIGGVFIYRDHARKHGMRRGKRFGEKSFGRFGISCRAQEELERVADRESTAR